MIPLVCCSVAVVAMLAMLVVSLRTDSASVHVLQMVPPHDAHDPPRATTECVGGPRDGLTIKWRTIDPMRFLTLTVPDCPGDLARYELRNGAYVYLTTITADCSEECE